MTSITLTFREAVRYDTNDLKKVKLLKIICCLSINNSKPEFGRSPLNQVKSVCWVAIQKFPALCWKFLYCIDGVDKSFVKTKWGKVSKTHKSIIAKKSIEIGCQCQSSQIPWTILNFCIWWKGNHNNPSTFPYTILVWAVHSFTCDCWGYINLQNLSRIVVCCA